MTNALKLVVFTDLDGTLLDHATYRWDAALPALTRLDQLGCPLVFASSKTAAEIQHLQREMGLTARPAIVENGAGLIGFDAAMSTPVYHKLRRILSDVPSALRQHFTGFGDMHTADVIAATGLSDAAAQRAQDRQFSEPGLWRGSAQERDAFCAALAEKGVIAQQGGRFLTLSFGQTKQDAVVQITKALKPEICMALGDAPNDITMLEATDIGVIVANPHRSAIPPLKAEQQGRIIRTTAPGPEGWNTAVNDVLDRVFSEQGSKADG